ncbi:uncharacterized protein DS421_14g456980 [Arachis hypogaea]|nr:uncharacterized protein DS421_14g456980 [Arachis hypogaea]
MLLPSSSGGVEVEDEEKSREMVLQMSSVEDEEHWVSLFSVDGRNQRGISWAGGNLEEWNTSMP